MRTPPIADDFFDDVDYVSIISTIKGIYTSDGSMSVLLDIDDRNESIGKRIREAETEWKLRFSTFMGISCSLF